MVRCLIRLLAPLTLVLLVAPLVAEAQPPSKVPRVGVLGERSPTRVAGIFVRKYTLSSNPFQFNRIQGNYAKFSTRCCGIPWG